MVWSHSISGMLSSSSTCFLRAPFLGWAAMDGSFSNRTVLFGVGSGPLVWCRVAAWVMRSIQAWLSAGRAQTNCFVDDPVIAPRGTSAQRRELAIRVLLWWRTLGLKLAYEKGSFGPEVVWNGTHFAVQSVVNKVEISLLAKKIAEILETLKEIMDNSRGMVKHPDIRKLAGKESWMAGFLPQLKPFVRQLWAGLYKDRSDDKVELIYKRQVWRPALTWLRKGPPGASACLGEASLLGGSVVGWACVGGGRQHDEELLVGSVQGVWRMVIHL